MMKRFLRGSSSRSSKDKQSEEEERPKYNLPRTAEVRLCEWPCDDFLRAAGIYDDFYELAEIARLQAAAHDAMTAASQYDSSYNFGYPPGHPWQ